MLCCVAVAFRAYDADRSGYIDKTELRAMMMAGLSAQGCVVCLYVRTSFDSYYVCCVCVSACRYAVDGEVLDGMVDECMDIIDVNGDGRVSLEEFKDAWRNPQLHRQVRLRAACCVLRAVCSPWLCCCCSSSCCCCCHRRCCLYVR